MLKNKIVAVVGMCGSGKSVLTDLFVNKGWTKIYFGQLTMDVLAERGLEKNEANERAVREGLRKDHGQAAFAILLEERIRNAANDNNVILDGLYSWSEYKHLKQAFGEQFSVLAIVANRSTRYGRLTNRLIRPLTAEDAAKRDYSEIENIEKGGPIAIADRYIINNGSLQELDAQFEEFLR
ncbi:MAG: AAA family ATPase [Clostridia bacterium]